VAKLPTRSPTHEDVPIARLASMGMELDEIAVDEAVDIEALAELAEDRGRPASHYLAAVALATELRVGPDAPLAVKVCVGLPALRCARPARPPRRPLAPCEGLRDHARVVPRSVRQAPACEIHGAHGKLALAPTTTGNLDEALDSLAS